MKKIKFLLVVGALLICSAEANAGWFGANWKPKPNVTLFGQTITWPLPSLCIGAKAGVLPDAGVSSKGLNLKIPYFALDLPFPSLAISTGKDNPKVEVGVGSVTVSDHDPKKKKKKVIETSGSGDYGDSPSNPNWENSPSNPNWKKKSE